MASPREYLDSIIFLSNDIRHALEELETDDELFELDSDLVAMLMKADEIVTDVSCYLGDAQERR